MFVGKAQEKASVFRTERRRSDTGATYPWLFRSTSMTNQYYFYIYDEDFSPLFIKFCSYFPFGIKLCTNGQCLAQMSVGATRYLIRGAG